MMRAWNGQQQSSVRPVSAPSCSPALSGRAGAEVHKAVAGLYILVVFADALPGAKAQFTALELPHVPAVSVAVWRMLFWHRRQKNSPVRSKNAVSARRVFRSG